ncbi:glutamine amidotransferase [Candidatus Saccharibacteria bacterium]|nr:glutamine amidotransferase [Candidatus Saccharibacteria bacterium]
MKKSLTLVQLYPRDMNIYGDTGNVLVVQKRAEWHGYDVNVIDYNPEDAFPSEVDIVIGGGGQDSGQIKIQQDLQALAPTLKTLANNGTPMLMVCGLYQLFGKFFKTAGGEIIPGINIMDHETHAGPTRLIGNIVTKSQQFGDIIGYENHSGQTFLSKGLAALGQVIKGAGNNGQDASEGAQYNNVIGTYLHGSLLPKNPQIADFLIEQAAINKYGEFTPSVIDDRFATAARKVAISRSR